MALWNLKVHLNLRHFIWKGCKNILVMHTNLQCRGIRLEPGYLFCTQDMETQVHLFFCCPFARVFWFGSPLQLGVTMVVGGDFMECWKWLCKKYGEEGRLVI